MTTSEAARALGIRDPLGEADFRGLAEIPEGEVDQGLDVIGIRLLPSEGVGQPGGWIDLTELPSQIGRHRSPAAASPMQTDE
jgi:hypothetical protein